MEARLQIVTANLLGLIRQCRSPPTLVRRMLQCFSTSHATKTHRERTMRPSNRLRMTSALLSFILMPTIAEAADFAIEASPGKHIDVSYKDRVVLRLMTANDTSNEKAAHETYKVYAHVMDPADPDNKRTLTKGAGSQYTHHRGIYIGFSKANVDGVGGVDTWHMKSGVRQHLGQDRSTKH